MQPPAPTENNPPPRVAFPLGWALAPALVLAGLAGALALAGANQPLFVALNHASAALPPRLWAVVTVCGSVLGAIALLAATIKTQPRWLASTFLAAPLGVLISEGGKRYFDVMRPAGVLEPERFNLIGQKLYVHAFPSGHSVTAFCVAAAIVLAWPKPERRWRAGLIALPLAGLVAFSRIAVGAHWPLDVLTGAAGGWLAGALGAWLTTRTDFLHSPRGARTMAAVALATSLAMLFIDLGQPDARLFRIGLAAWGIGGAAAALMQDREPRA
ncbi:phosphatase PAP2 family protein [Zoogloea sp.]|uniref:phosphatase PAP2 family protein n=1 Tax=Zoogloea sp. TaxID=49181 RepID=UPI0035AF1B36